MSSQLLVNQILTDSVSNTVSIATLYDSVCLRGGSNTRLIAQVLFTFPFLNPERGVMETG